MLLQSDLLDSIKWKLIEKGNSGKKNTYGGKMQS